MATKADAENSEIRKMLAGIEASLKKVESEFDRSNRALYAVIGNVCELAEICLKDPVEFGKLCEEKEIRLTNNIQNPYTPIVKLIWGTWKVSKDGKKTWEPSRSALKYANVVRYMSDHQVPHTDVADKIVALNGIGKIVSADTKIHGRPPINDTKRTDNIAVTRNRMEKAPSLAVVSLPQDVQPTDGFVLLIGRVDANREVEIKQFADVPENVIKGIVARMAATKKDDAPVVDSAAFLAKLTAQQQQQFAEHKKNGKTAD